MVWSFGFFIWLLIQAPVAVPRLGRNLESLDTCVGRPARGARAPLRGNWRKQGTMDGPRTKRGTRRGTGTSQGRGTVTPWAATSLLLMHGLYFALPPPPVLPSGFVGSSAGESAVPRPLSRRRPRTGSSVSPSCPSPCAPTTASVRP
ncbi:hypothetical protein TCAP_05139 [Tolypocladium capitatum]|uniref:Secreted protein n=1 Tax=Tolypocladium capitatum TaxID=45235 RepID=A0A2K3QBN4_9HYPO|nr:hypothetical protein TCAP_05139 [Tolypocladium capitatum]